MKNQKRTDRLIVALDEGGFNETIELLDRLIEARVRWFKVGKSLFTRHGPELIARIKERRGARVFLDLKYHDIPNTVAGAVEAAIGLGVDMTTLHALGGFKALEAARAARGSAPMKLIGVTVLTSHDSAELKSIGFDLAPARLVSRLASIAREAGLDGVVSSAREVGAIKAAFGSEFLAVTPGIRDTSGQKNDQARSATPEEAIKAGADYLVVGRPITKSPDPTLAARSILKRIESFSGSL